MFIFSHVDLSPAIRTTRREPQLKFYILMAVPALLCRSESWVLEKKEGSHIQATEIKLVREIMVYTLHNHIRKEI
jgi:hypothetical protein